MQAELDGVICSGPRRGKQFTYALLDERAPQARSLLRDEALAELTKRYFTSHGPAMVKDFVWWSGLTAADAKAGLEMVGPRLIHEVINSQTYWFSASVPPLKDISRTAFLLPTYDEYVIGYTDRSAMLDAARAEKLNPLTDLVFDSMILMGGQAIGSWKRTLNKETALIEIAPFRPFTAAESEAIAAAAAQRYGDFFGLPVVIHRA